MKRCPVCAELLADDLTSCPYCGEPLEVNASTTYGSSPQQQVGNGMQKCPVCGELIASNLTTCPICGESINQTFSQTVSQQSASPSSAPTDESPSPIEESNQMRPCSVCGESISVHSTTCPYCHEPTGFEEKVSEPTSRANNDSDPRVAAAAAIGAVFTNAAASNQNPPPPAEPIIDDALQEALEPEPAPQYTPEPEPAPQYTPEPQPAPQYTPEPQPAPQYTPEPQPAPQYTQEPSQAANNGQYGYQPNTQQSHEPPYVPPVTPQKSGGLMKFLLAALIALLVMGLGAALYFFVIKDKDTDEDEGNPTVEDTRGVTEGDGDLTFDDTSKALDEKENVEANEVQEVQEEEVTTTQPKQSSPVVNTPVSTVPKQSSRPNPGYDGAYDDVAPSRDHHRHDGRFDRRPPRDEYGRPGPPPHHGRDRGNSEVAPPNPGGTGFHLETQGGRNQQQQGNNGSGFKLQQVDRIPNK